MRVMKIGLVLGLAACLSGCMASLKAKVEPGQTFDDLGKVYVAHFEPDKRNLHQMIASELSGLGYPAASGELNDMPAGTDTLVTYVDNWMWDITNYMIRITIKFKDATTKEVIVSGESYRTSAVRKDPEYMIRETLKKILEEKNKI